VAVTKVSRGVAARNRGPNPCTVCVVLIAAKPVTAGGKVLNAVG
jgi:hypothetical protein